MMALPRRRRIASSRPKAAAVKAPDEPEQKLVEKIVLADARFEWKLFIWLLAFRFYNTLLVQTFFVPDEYWQGPEVAHKLVFGYGFQTWEWLERIRGYTHPLIFASVYKLLSILRIDSPRAVILAPRLVQGVFAAVGDIHLYMLCCKLFGAATAKWALACNVVSWFTLYCITRTLANSLETVLTVVALTYWPWTRYITETTSMTESFKGGSTGSFKSSSVLLSLTFAAMACLIRPTAAIMWAPLCIWYLLASTNRYQFMVNVLSVAAVAGLWSFLLDSWMFGQWTVVQLNFLHFNIVKNFSTFYGTHPWYWYFVVGFPVMMFTLMIPFVMGIYHSRPHQRILLVLMMEYVLVHSVLCHKEFRFILPVLPLAMCFCGLYFNILSKRDGDQNDKQVEPSTKREKGFLRRIFKGQWTVAKLLMLFVATTNILLALYACLVHQRGTNDVIAHILRNCEKSPSKPSVLFLMPCHSTPYYSNIHHNISMRSLQCPPDDTPGYIDEADRFYNNPMAWIRREILAPDSKMSLPSHIILFDELLPKIRTFLQRHSYVECRRFFHSHFPSGRVGSVVLVYCVQGKKKPQKIPM